MPIADEVREVLVNLDAGDVVTIFANVFGTRIFSNSDLIQELIDLGHLDDNQTSDDIDNDED